MAEARPIPVASQQASPAQAVMTQVAEPMAQQASASNVTALRHPSAQTERVIIPDPMPYPDEPVIATQQREAVRQSDPGLKVGPRPPSNLFAGVQRSNSEAHEVTPPQMPQSLFQLATGMFRKRAAVLPPVTNAAPKRKEPLSQSMPEGVTTMETDPSYERRAPMADDNGMDIPAFLRRQTSAQ